MNDQTKIIEALAFAAERHKGQIRKGIGKTPYIDHPVAVSKLLSKFGENDPDLIISALLHDVVEDTTKNDNEIKKLSDEILNKFGENVLLTVLEVSDDGVITIDDVAQGKQIIKFDDVLSASTYFDWNK